MLAQKDAWQIKQGFSVFVLLTLSLGEVLGGSCHVLRLKISELNCGGHPFFMFLRYMVLMWHGGRSFAWSLGCLRLSVIIWFYILSRLK